MKSDIRFDECKDCVYREYSDKLVGCAANRLSLAWHRMIKELPIINKFIDDNRYCYWFIEDKEIYD